MSYVLMFCRFTLLFLFILASVGKIRHPRRFNQALQRLQLAPPRLTGGLTVITIAGELLVVICLTRGADWLRWGFGLAALLLTVFTMGLLSVLHRHVKAPCACFGLSEKPASRYDVWRNLVSLLLALAGLGLVAVPYQPQQPVDTTDLIVIMFASLVYAVVLTQFGALIATLVGLTPPVKPKHN